MARSKFAQALYDLMITPGIDSLEQWCFFINPWVEKSDGQNMISTWSTEAKGNPETMALINSWFADEKLPKPRDLQTIIIHCSGDNSEILMGFASGEISQAEVDEFVNKWQKGKDLQAKALENLYQVLDMPVREATPLYEQWVELGEFRCGPNHDRVGSYLMSDSFFSLWAQLSQIPFKHRHPVFVRVMETIRKAEKNNWYLSSPDDKVGE